MPYTYLAHYDYLQTQEGREFLNKIGLPNTMRLVLLTLEILPSNARFIDFINGLIASDEVLFKNKNHGDLIKSVATSRGLYKAKTVLLQFN